MSDGFFASLIPAGTGAKGALQRHVELRRDEEQARPRRGYRYHGAHDLLAAHGTYFTGRELPDRWRDDYGPESHCHMNSLAAALKHDELRYFTGLYMAGGQALFHSWCVDAEGAVVELTLRDTKAIQEENPHGKPMYLSAFRNSGVKVPWIGPTHWAYVGVEYDPEFANGHAETRGLPILDPVPQLYLSSEELPMFKTQYTPEGFEFTAPPAALFREHGGWGEDDEDDEDNPYDAEEPEFV